MVRVRVEFWMWSGREPGLDFGSPADRHATLNLCVADGTTVRALFESLERHPMIKKEIFDHSFYPSVALTLNNAAMGHDEVYDRVLNDGDRILVLPAFAGG